MRREGKQMTASPLPVSDLSFSLSFTSRLGAQGRHSTCVSHRQCHHFNHSRNLPFRNVYCFLAPACSLEIWGKEAGKRMWLFKQKSMGWDCFFTLGDSLGTQGINRIGTEQGKWHIPSGLTPLFISHNPRDSKLEDLPACLSQDLG